MNAFTTTAIVVGTTYAGEAVQHKPMTFRPLISGWVLGLFLVLVSEVSPRSSDAFMALVVITAILINGPKFFPAVNKLVGQ